MYLFYKEYVHYFSNLIFVYNIIILELFINIIY